MLEKKLENTEDMCKVVDAVYAMGRTIEERKGIKRGDKRKNKKEENEENRRVRKMKKQIKEVRQVVTWAATELYKQEKNKEESYQKRKEDHAEIREVGRPAN